MPSLDISRLRALTGILLLGVVSTATSAQKPAPLRLGYFLGGKTYALFRAFQDGSLEGAGANVVLLSKYLDQPEYVVVPKDSWRLRTMRDRGKFGKLSGVAVLRDLEWRIVDGGTAGESSFVQGVVAGRPVVAVAALQHDLKEAPAKAIVLRTGITIERQEDFAGLTLASRRGGPGEEIMLREFLATLDSNVQDRVHIRSQVSENDIDRLLATGEIDGGLLHFTTIYRVLTAGTGYIHRRMDWMNPELSMGLLVFRRDVLESNPEAVGRLIEGYMRRVRYEANLPADSHELLWPLYLDHRVPGMSLPRVTTPPRVRVELLQEVQELLLKYGYISGRVNLHRFIDNRFVDGINPSDAVRRSAPRDPPNRSPSPRSPHQDSPRPRG